MSEGSPCRESVNPSPKKPPRPTLRGVSKEGLDNYQDECKEHHLPLNFYCAKCNETVCRDCTVVSHPPKTHRVLDTPDALSALRTSAVTLLRHYTLVRSFHVHVEAALEKYLRHNPAMIQDGADIAKRLNISSGEYLHRVVEEAEAMVEGERNLRKLSARVREWGERQNEWNGVVFLALRCRLLGCFRAASDKVYLRMGDWILPAPWNYLLHLLEPYLGEQQGGGSTNSLFPRSSKNNRSPSPRGRDKVFPNNSRQMVLNNLLPYVIFNPEIRYFIQVCDQRETDVTLVVKPSEDLIQEYLKRRHNAATLSPGTLRKSHFGFKPADDSLRIVEKQFMMGGRHRSRLVGSYLPLEEGQAGKEATNHVHRLLKVSFADVKVVDGGRGLPQVVTSRGVKRGDVIIDQDPSGRPSLTVAMKDIPDASALKIGYVTMGLEGLVYLLEAEFRRNEASGLRAKIWATLKRDEEEEAVYQVTFGMDI